VISFGPEVRVFVATQPIDFRKGVHGLVALVAEGLAGEPYSGDVFVFRSKRSDRLKLLVFDGSGLILATKWLEEGDADRKSVGVVAGCPEGDEAAGESRLSRLVLLATPGAFV
jgi:hypothetical protein